MAGLNRGTLVKNLKKISKDEPTKKHECRDDVLPFSTALWFGKALA